MSDPQKSQVWLPVLLCLAVIVYLGVKLETKEDAPRESGIATFESRVEPLRDEAQKWAAGYYFHVGSDQPTPQPQPQVQPQPQPQTFQPRQYRQPVQPQTQRRPLPQRKNDEDMLLESLRRQNDSWRQFSEENGW
jgi:hypothetical protein